MFRSNISATRHSMQCLQSRFIRAGSTLQPKAWTTGFLCLGRRASSGPTARRSFWASKRGLPDQRELFARRQVCDERRREWVCVLWDWKSTQVRGSSRFRKRWLRVLKHIRKKRLKLRRLVRNLQLVIGIDFWYCNCVGV